MGNSNRQQQAATFDIIVACTEQASEWATELTFAAMARSLYVVIQVITSATENGSPTASCVNYADGVLQPKPTILPKLCLIHLQFHRFNHEWNCLLLACIKSMMNFNSMFNEQLSTPSISRCCAVYSVLAPTFIHRNLVLPASAAETSIHYSSGVWILVNNKVKKMPFCNLHRIC